MTGNAVARAYWQEVFAGEPLPSTRRPAKRRAKLVRTVNGKTTKGGTSR